MGIFSRDSEAKDDNDASFLDTVKENYKEGKETVEKESLTQNYTTDEAEDVATQMANSVNPRILRRKRLGKAPLDRLDNGESLEYLLMGFDLDIDDNDEGSRSQLLVSNKKVVMIASSITGKSSQYTVAFNDIIGVSVQRRLRSHIRIQTAGHSYKISAAGSSPELADEVVEYIRKQKAKLDETERTTTGKSALDKLDKLADLRDRGVVSEEEFKKKKEELLNDI